MIELGSVRTTQCALYFFIWQYNLGTKRPAVFSSDTKRGIKFVLDGEQNVFTLKRKGSPVVTFSQWTWSVESVKILHPTHRCVGRYRDQRTVYLRVSLNFIVPCLSVCLSVVIQLLQVG